VGLTGLTLRRATVADAAGAVRVLNEAITGGAPTLLDTPLSEQEERAFIQSLPPRCALHVAELPGEGIVGIQGLTLAVRYASRQLDHVGEIGTYVAERWRRHGIGGKLAEVTFAWARANGFEKIFTDIRADNLPSLSFHLSLGFHVVGTAQRHAKVEGRYLDVWLVERQL
jgi:L-amino acid N-acyltransferase YncA